MTDDRSAPVFLPDLLALTEHYRRQAESLGEEEAPLRQTIEEFRANELVHRDLALAHDARTAPAHDLLTAAVKAGSRIAIWLSTRI